MSFVLRDHTADVAVEATAADLGGVFAAVANGMAAAMCDEIPDAGGDRFDLEERAETREALLFDYLDRLIYERDVRGVLPVDNEAVVGERDGEWVVEGSARGVPLESVHARDLKAVTYSQMDLSERDGDPRSTANEGPPDGTRESDGGWHAYVVFDV